MYATNAAGGKDVNAGALRYPAGGGDGRGAIPALRHGDWQIARADLFDLSAVGDVFDLIRVQADRENSLKNCDGRRSRSAFRDDLLQTPRSFQILWMWKSVRDYG